jgi:hypothetical protein
MFLGPLENKTLEHAGISGVWILEKIVSFVF